MVKIPEDPFLIKVDNVWYEADELLLLASQRHIILSDEQEAFVDKYRSPESRWRFITT